MASRRQRQVAELLHEEISGLIQYQTQDPRLGFVTVTDVEVSPDLQRATIFVSVMGDEADAKESLAGLTSATGYFKYKLGQTVKLRRIPDLIFKIDTSLDYALHIDELLDQIKEEEGDLRKTSPEDETND